MGSDGTLVRELIRIGEKLVNKDRVHRRVDEILALRAAGASQQEVADRLRVDRAFVSRLEGLGEVRKGGRVALVGFPVANKAELHKVAEASGVDWILLMDNQERWGFLAEQSGAGVFNRVLEIISELQTFDAVVFIGSDMRIRLAKAVFGPETVIGLELGPTPIEDDRYVDPAVLARLLGGLKV